MKKKILSGLFALALLVTAGFGVQTSMKSDAILTDLALSNVEALAFYEGSIDDFAALCTWGNFQYCHYYVTFPDGSGYGYSHWNMKIDIKSKHSGESAIYLDCNTFHCAKF